MVVHNCQTTIELTKLVCRGVCLQRALQRSWDDIVYRCPTCLSRGARLLLIAAIPSQSMNGCGQLDERDLLTLEVAPKFWNSPVAGTSEDLLWKIRLDGREIDIIRYGELPLGGSQLFPPHGQRPRPFSTGEHLKKTTVTVDGYVDHSCTATGEASIRCGMWEWHPQTTPPGASTLPNPSPTRR